MSRQWLGKIKLGENLSMLYEILFIEFEKYKNREFYIEIGPWIFPPAGGPFIYKYSHEHSLDKKIISGLGGKVDLTMFICSGRSGAPVFVSDPSFDLFLDKYRKNGWGRDDPLDEIRNKNEKVAKINNTKGSLLNFANGLALVIFIEDSHHSCMGLSTVPFRFPVGFEHSEKAILRMFDD